MADGPAKATISCQLSWIGREMQKINYRCKNLRQIASTHCTQDKDRKDDDPEDEACFSCSSSVVWTL